MRPRLWIALIGALVVGAGAAYAAQEQFQVTPSEFAPEGTPLVQATWLGGIGCPTNARTAIAPPPDFETEPGPPYTEPVCATGDANDKRVEGLLLAKTGPTTNVAAAQAHIKGVKGQVITELGYDIRKPLATVDPRGSHCGGGAPRFNVTTEEGNFYFVACNSPLPVQTTSGGWLRLRWTTGPFIGQHIEAIEIVFDEGQDTGPDNFGLAVLDNIDISGVLVGRGATEAD
jgi:hypothetical protein